MAKAKKYLELSGAELEAERFKNGMPSPLDGMFSRYETLHECCGIVEIGCFTAQRLPQFYSLKQFRLHLASRVVWAMALYNTNSVICTTTNDTDVNIRRAIPAIGFTPLLKTKNPKTSMVITLWGFTRSGVRS